MLKIGTVWRIRDTNINKIGIIFIWDILPSWRSKKKLNNRGWLETQAHNKSQIVFLLMNTQT